MYRWAGEVQGWHDECRFYQVDEVVRGTVFYHWAGTWETKADPRPRFTASTERWAEWASKEGAPIGRDERLKMVPA